MGKTLYSLMLSEDVVREVDRLAHHMGTNRSSYINEILAEHMNLNTPEGRIRKILSEIENTVRESHRSLSCGERSSSRMCVKSVLEYKYRPCVRYELAFVKDAPDTPCEISVKLRSRSEELIEKSAEFFRLLRLIESRDLPDTGIFTSRFSTLQGKYSCQLSFPSANLSPEELAAEIAGYIIMLDGLFSDFISGSTDALGLEDIYCSHLINSRIGK